MQQKTMYSITRLSDELGAELYRHLHPDPQPSAKFTQPNRVCEVGGSFEFSEKHIQALWYDPTFRPRDLKTTEDVGIEVIHPGIWNLEEGPDFLDAILCIDGKVTRGDVEIHIHPNDWNAHGHSDDPNYQRVVCHVTWFPETQIIEGLPSGCHRIFLEACFTTSPRFSLKQIDTAAYPFEVLPDPTPLAQTIKSWSRLEKEHFLDHCGLRRLNTKRLQLQRNIERVGPEQCLYEEILRSLGYKNNCSGFVQLAQRLPVKQLLRVADGDVMSGLAGLLGMAGLIHTAEAQLSGWFDTEHIRELHRLWWELKPALKQAPLEPEQWNQRCRPANSPTLRILAAAILFCSQESLWELVDSPSLQAERHKLGEHPFRPLLEGLEVDAIALNAKRRTRLVGRPRAVSMLNNVLIPFIAAQSQEELCHAKVQHLPAEPSNSVIRECAHQLFGPDHTPKLYRTGLRRQGLVHLFYAYGFGHRRDPET